LTSVLCAVEGPVATVTLNRPAKRNAIDAELAERMEGVLDRVEADDAVRVVVLTGAGGTFSAGADLRAMAEGGTPRPHPARGGFAGFVRYPRTKPVIAAVNGYALGGGLELVLASDIVVAAEDASFGLPEVGLGLIAAGGGVFRLPRAVPPARARELILTGERFGAPEALEMGLVNHVVTPQDVLPTARAIAFRIARNSPLAVKESLAIARAAGEMDDNEAWRRSAEAVARLRAGGDAREGPRAFTAKRDPRWAT
jgi:enoyl-CoA hydratase/carnithine racemase